MRVRYKPIEFEAIEVTRAKGYAGKKGEASTDRSAWPDWLSSKWDDGEMWTVPGAIIISSGDGPNYIAKVGDYIINDGMHVSTVAREDFDKYFEVVE